MPTLNLDFGDVGKIPPEGYWRVVCEMAEVVPTADKTGKNIRVKLTLLDMPSELENFDGETIMSWISLHPNADWKQKEFLEAFTGEPWEEDDMEIEITDDDPPQVPLVMGETAIILGEHSTYRGRENLSVTTFFPDNGEIEIGAAESNVDSVI